MDSAHQWLCDKYIMCIQENFYSTFLTDTAQSSKAETMNRYVYWQKLLFFWSLIKHSGQSKAIFSIHDSKLNVLDWQNRTSGGITLSIFHYFLTFYEHNHQIDIENNLFTIKICQDMFPCWWCSLTPSSIKALNFYLNQIKQRNADLKWAVLYLGGEHVSNPIHGALQEQSANQETNQHDVREQGAEVHHLQDKQNIFIYC